jgi:DNA-directed RNA polymerase specialized sigma24 family protein
LLAPSLRRYARGLTANRERADDLAQDTLERVWSMWQQRGEIRAWMARHHAQPVHRSAARVA